MTEVRLPFGKHKGLPLHEVIYVDPDYVEWLRCQSDLIRRYPSVAKGLADLGASGDETPTHNAIQTYFLEEAPCRALIKRLWGGGLSAKLARLLLTRERRSELGDLIGCASSYMSSTKRAELLKETALVRRRLLDLGGAQSLGDQELFKACRVSSLSSEFWDLTSQPAFEVRSRLESLVRAHRSKLDHLRRRIATMRGQLLEVRERFDSVAPDTIQLNFKRTLRKFEESNGSDVHLRYVLDATLPGRDARYPDESWTFDMWIEIKPYLSDDYPSVLRQMTLQKKQATNQCTRESRFVLVVGRYGGQGATLDQLRQIFKDASFDLIMLEEIGCNMPKVASLKLGGLPLFQE